MIKRLGNYCRINEKGFTVFELLVATGLSAIVFTGLMLQYSSSIKAARDHQLRIATQVQAQAIVQTLVSELRMLGNGVPFDQANFRIDETALSDPSVADPLDVSTATSTNLAFRLNESGEVYLLTQNFNPALGNTVYLTTVEGLDDNDPVYLSNSVVSGDDGLYATISSVDTEQGSITLQAGSVVASPGAVFNMGSICEEVPLVTYNSPSDGSGITRDSGFGPVLLGERSTMSLEYLDFNGTALGLPMTNDDVVDRLRSIRITVTVTGASDLSTGEPYTTSVTQVVGLRNLNYFF